MSECITCFKIVAGALFSPSPVALRALSPRFARARSLKSKNICIQTSSWVSKACHDTKPNIRLLLLPFSNMPLNRQNFTEIPRSLLSEEVNFTSICGYIKSVPGTQIFGFAAPNIWDPFARHSMHNQVSSLTKGHYGEGSIIFWSVDITRVKRLTLCSVE